MIPDFQSMMLPLLELMADGVERRHADLFGVLAVRFGLSDDDLKQLLPSGSHPTYENRIRWAKWYLTRAGLLESTGHGVFRISPAGLEMLEYEPTSIGLSDLKPLIPATQGTDELETVEPGSQTPEEALASTFHGLNDELAQDLLVRVMNSSPQFFERLVVELLVRMGYGGSRRDAAEAVGKSGDGGIDGVIKEDPLGLDIVYVQAKKWSGTVGRPLVQGFAGSLDGKKARKGIMIATSSFSKDAHQYVSEIEKKIVLIDGRRLTNLMIEHGVGVTAVDTYIVKRLDEDFFEAEAPSAAPESYEEIA